MTAFKSSGSGGGITPAQLDQLVSDGELSGAEATIINTVLARIAQGVALSPSAATQFIGLVDDSIRTITSGEGVDLRPEAWAHLATVIQGLALTVGLSATERAAINTAIAGVQVSLPASEQASLKTALTGMQVTLTDAERTTLTTTMAAAGALSGEVRLFKSTTVPAGWTRLTGISAPASLFTKARVVLGNFSQSPGSVAFSTTEAGCWTPNSDGSLLTLITSTGVLRSYNPGTEAWTQLATCPQAATSAFTFAAVVGAKHYYFGATAGTGAGQYTFCYDASTNAWTQVASAPSVRCYARGCYDATTGLVYQFGGYSSTSSFVAGTMLGTVLAYNPTTNTFTTKATAMPFRCGYARATPLGGGKILVWPVLLSTDGGVSAGYGRRCWVYDAVADSWTEVDQIPAEVGVTYNGTWGAIATGKVVYIPLAPPSSGARARQFIYANAAGSQWQSYAISYTDDGVASGTALAPNQNSAGYTDNCVLSSGLIPVGARLGTGGMFTVISTNTDGTVPNADAFYAMKN